MIVSKNIGHSGSNSTNNVATDGVSTLPLDYEGNSITVSRIRFVINYSGGNISLHGRTFGPGSWNFENWSTLPITPISSGGSIGATGALVGYCQ